MQKKVRQNGPGWDQLLKHIKEERPLTTFEVSKICGVVNSTVSNWIDEGKLDAYRTPGGHRRIKKQNLLIFLKLYDIPVPDELMNDMEMPPEVEQKSGENGRHKRIMIVEDDRDSSELIFEILRQDHPEYEIVQAFDGFEAGKQIVKFAPDLVILDLLLPGVDGFKVLQNIRQDKNCVKTKILAITAYDTTENRERILQAGGVDGFLNKPMDLKLLREYIESIFSLGNQPNSNERDVRNAKKSE